MVVNLNDYKIIDFPSGKKKAYKAICNKCGHDKGYVSLYQAKKHPLCRQCSSLLKHEKADVHAISVVEGKRNRLLFKSSCALCKKDRGFVRKDRVHGKCRSCCQKGKKHSIHSRIKNSASHQGILVDNFVDFKTAETKKTRDLFNKSQLSYMCFKNSNFACDVCLVKGSKLNAHHLYSWHTHPELRFDLSNLVSLCIDCHRAFHKQYGHKNNTKQQFLSFKHVK